MNDELPRLVVIDDSQEFLKFLETGLGSCFRIACLLYKPGLLDQILANIRSAEADHLLLDLNLGCSGKSQQLLERATERRAISPDCKVWIISERGRENEDEILKGFQRINANTQNRLLHKPITPHQVCAELLDESVYAAEDPLGDSFPLPLRVLSRKGRVAYANQLWTIRDYPKPCDSTPWLNNGEVPESQDYVGSFFGADKAGFMLHSFRLEQKGEPFLGQILEQYSLKWFPKDLFKTVESIFETMRQAEFTRGRYYDLHPLTQHQESDDYDSVAELSRLSYPEPSGLKLPYRFPVKGEPRRHIEDYGEMNKKRLSERVHYRIRTAREDQETDDPYINKLLRLLKVKDWDSWLEVPVWIRDDFTPPGDKPTYRMAGGLIFDRAGTDTLAGIDREVTEENVQPLEPLLRSLLCLLSLALKRVQDHELKEYERRMRWFDQELLEADDNMDRYKKVLAALRRESSARSGIMVVPGNDPDRLEVVVAEGDGLPPGLTKLRLPLEANYHPIVQAFNSNKQYAYQDFQSGQQVEKLIEGIQLSSSQYWQSLNSSEQEQFINWLREIKGLIAIPVMIGTKRAIGSITLQFDQKWSITRRKEIQINYVLQRARWVMRQDVHEKEQYYWQQALGHELKTELYTMEQCVYKMEQDQPKLSDSAQWLQLKRFLLDSRDLAENWRDILPKGRVETISPFPPHAAIQYYVKLNEQRIGDDKLNLNWCPSWEGPVWMHLLSGNHVIFARVVRILLDNAFKFGRAAVPDEDEVVITLTARTENGLWVFEIQNPGQMTPEEYALRFIAGEIPKEERKASGAHVGLSVAYSWVRHFSGTLAVENEEGNRVRTSLSWPISQP